jgi:hypothetical protein
VTAEQELALELAEGLEATPANIERVAKETSPEAARWAFGQWQLRRQARGKFALAERMLFTREALEQASHEEVARYHASRYPEGALAADLTAGIGADAIALGRRGPVIAFELDEERAGYARHNLAAHGLAAEVRLADSAEADWTFDYAFADPSRRVAGRRTLDPEAFAPDPVELAERMRRLKLGGLKLSPMLPDEFLESLGGELEFVSFGGECREALVWLGTGAEIKREAVHLESGERLAAREDWAAQADRPAEFLFEADPAAIRAHGLPELCGRHELELLGDSNGYLTGSVPAESPWMRRFEVVESFQADLKRTKSRLRELDASVEVVKTRARGVEPERLLKQLRTEGQRRLTLCAYTVGKRVMFALVTSA